MLGLHPYDTKQFDAAFVEYITNLKKTEPKLIGLGEIGLDYYHNKENKEQQKNRKADKQPSG